MRGPGLLSRLSNIVRKADTVSKAGRQHEAGRDRESCPRFRVVEDPVHASEVTYTGTGRSLNWLSDGLSPPHESDRSTMGMNRTGKSDRLIVPEKPTNKEDGAPSSAETVEGRSLAKGNSSKQNKVRTQRRERNRYGAP